MKRKILPSKGVSIYKEEVSRYDVIQLENDKNKWIAAIEPRLDQLTDEQKKQFRQAKQPLSELDYEENDNEELVRLLEDDIKILQELVKQIKIKKV
jgi:hypothetical protein